MKRVDPRVYTKKYYLTDCTGYKEYKRSFGELLEVRFEELLPFLKFSIHDTVLDVGCGRGELVYFSAKEGAEAYGIDYSKHAIALANNLKGKKEKNVQKRMNFKVMDAKNLEFPDSFFSAIIMTDVMEHLYPEELEEVLKELKRVLKKNGKIIIHTAPNKFFNGIGYKYYSYPVSSLGIFIWNKLLQKKYPNISHPNSLRTDSHAIMHINEPTYFSLKKLFLKTGFKDKTLSSNVTAIKPILSFKDTLYNLFVFFHPLSKYFPLNIIFGSDFVSVLTKK
jgi:ubiquinone/menaquinone biosynthesis C-methylase UbiE